MCGNSANEKSFRINVALFKSWFAKGAYTLDVMLFLNKRILNMLSSFVRYTNTASVLCFPRHRGASVWALLPWINSLIPEKMNRPLAFIPLLEKKNTCKKKNWHELFDLFKLGNLKLSSRLVVNIVSFKMLQMALNVHWCNVYLYHII